MAKPSASAREHIDRSEKMQWEDLANLWEQIKNEDSTGWGEGKALEHLVIRGFRLSGLTAEYPYDVPPGGKPIEQIDGLVYLGDTPFLVECKDKDSIDVEAIAKLRNQLTRRPPATMGCVFVSGRFTDPALLLCDFALPHRVTLWSGVDIEKAIAGKDLRAPLVQKYQHLCMYGLTDYSPHYKDLEV